MGRGNFLAEEASMLWDVFRAALEDQNQQNDSAANAGDGPKHIALLTILDMLQDRLKVIVETHAGGGAYLVPHDSFCIDLPEESILGRHTRAAEFPSATGNREYYSASSDQIFHNAPEDCSHLAFEKNLRTKERLEELARIRGRISTLKSFSRSFRGNGDPKTSLKSILASCSPNHTLLVIDPFRSKDFDAIAAAQVDEGDPKSVLPTILFGSYQHRNKQGFLLRWKQSRHHLKGMYQIEWSWQGQNVPGKLSPSFFQLLIAMPDHDQISTLHQRLSEEHETLVKCRERSHGYLADPPCVTSWQR